MTRTGAVFGGLLRWFGFAFIVMGVIAPVIVRSIWAVPMALVLADPRWTGLALVAIGLVLIAIAWLAGRAGLGRNFGRLVSGVLALAIAATTWSLATTEYDLAGAEFHNEEATLRGTLVLPDRSGPYPAIVFMHGSGPESGALWFHLADRFARSGVAALIYDKRGSGASTGGHPRDPYSDLAGDAVAAVGWLRDHPAIDPERIGLWGISEGGWTAPLAASMAPDDIAFLVVVSGGGAAPEAEDLYSIRTHLEDQGISADEITRALDLRVLINDYYRTGENREGLLEAVRASETTDWFQAAGSYLPRASEIYVHETEEWERHMMFLSFDAVPLLKDLELPMLSIHGGRDRSYPTDVSVDRLSDIAALSGKDLTIRLYEDADHAIFTRFFPWPRYADGYVDNMIDWVSEKVVDGDG